MTVDILFTFDNILSVTPFVFQGYCHSLVPASLLIISKKYFCEPIECIFTEDEYVMKKSLLKIRISLNLAKNNPIRS